MTTDEKIITSIKGINKWVFFNLNYATVSHKWIDECGNERCEQVPQFLIEVEWTCHFNHMMKKWREALQTKDSSAYLIRFYMELDTTNREAMLEWILHNYNDEKEL